MHTLKNVLIHEEYLLSFLCSERELSVFVRVDVCLSVSNGMLRRRIKLLELVRRASEKSGKHLQ